MEPDAGSLVGWTDCVEDACVVIGNSGVGEDVVGELELFLKVRLLVGGKP